MSTASTCRCCLLRPPDKDLRTAYTKLGKTEIYSDMLKDCYEINLVFDDEVDNGICEVCIGRLRDACDFKLQVQHCQDELLGRRLEPLDNMKQEIVDADDDNIMFLENLKEEAAMSDDYDDPNGDDDDDKKLAEILGISGVTVKRKLRKRTKKELRITTNVRKISLRNLEQAATNRYVKLKKCDLRNEHTMHKCNVKTVLQYSNCTPFSTKTLAGIGCAYCKDFYPDIQDLRTHTRENHKEDELNDNKRTDKNNLSIKMDITDLQCNVCGTNFDVISNLKTHLSKEHDVKFYTEVNDYILEFKLTAGAILNCALCNSTFETFKMLHQHMNGHYRNYICDVCDIGFINKHRLKNHQRIHELGTFKCSFCEKIFSTRIRKVCHEKYTHNSGARYTTNCPQCEKTFTSYYQRNRHMFKDHNTAAATYKCNICDKSFILKSKLTTHIKKVHLMERNHICSECGQGFFIKQMLDEHMVKHNGERVFKCTVCQKAYARKKTLREHMRIHNNDRRFKCGVCGSAFVQKCSLKSHMLSNHGISLSEYESVRLQMSGP